MKLFKERLKIACGGILLALIMIAPFVLIAWLVSLSHFAASLLYILVLSLPVGCVVYGIYWLFVEPFRKK